MNAKSRYSIRALAACGSAAALLAAAPAHAALFTTLAFFSENGRSVYGPGQGVALDTGPKFFGVDENLDATVGGVSRVCVPLVGCASVGAEAGGRARTKAGFGYQAKVDSGTFDFQYAGLAAFRTPDSVQGQQIGQITVGSGFNSFFGADIPTRPNGPRVFRQSQLQVRGPKVQASLDLFAELSAFAGARVCIVACTGPSIGPIDINESRELAAINRNGDGAIRVLGETIAANQSRSFFGGLINLNANIPNLDSSSAATPNGFDGTTLRSTKRDKLVGVNANLAQFAANAAGLPIPLSGNLGPLGYNLLQANAGLAIDIEQTLSFTPQVTGRYVFTSNVRPVVNGVELAETNVIDFNFGDDVTFAPGQVGAISYQPFINFGGFVTNQTSLVFNGLVDVKALGINVAGITLGPIIDEQFGSVNLARLDLPAISFFDNYGTIAAPSIDLDFTNCRNNTGSAEFPTLGICAASGYSSPFAQDNGDGTLTDRYDLLSCGPHPVGVRPFCLFIPDATTTSPYVNSVFGKYFLGNAGAAFAYDPVNPGASTTDADQLALLRELGFLGEQPFVIPNGAPPEDFLYLPAPDALVLFGLGAGLLALRRGRGRGRGRGLRA